MKTFTLLIVLLSLKVSWGQIEYRPLPETDAVWNQTELLYFMTHEWTRISSVVYTEGDTLINGQSYRKYGSHGVADWVDNFGSPQDYTSGTYNIPYYQSFFRQDIAQKKVFVWDGQTDKLLYDFGTLVIGQPYPETINNYNYPNLLVMGMDSVQLMDGNYYKRWVLGTNSTDSAYVSVIEGVGGTNGLTTPIYPVFEQSSALMCHKTGTQFIYEDWQGGIIPVRYSEDCSRTLSIHSQNETNLVVYPNPANAVVFIQSDKIIKGVEVYNVNGQLLLLQEVNSKGNEFHLDLSALEQGVYLFKIMSAEGTETMRQVQLIK